MNGIYPDYVGPDMAYRYVSLYPDFVGVLYDIEVISRPSTETTSVGGGGLRVRTYTDIPEEKINKKTADIRAQLLREDEEILAIIVKAAEYIYGEHT